MSIFTDRLHERRAALSPRLVVNGVLVAAAVALGVLAYVQVGTKPAATTVTRTSSVARGVVLSSVSATGNVQAARTLSLDFGTAGTVAAIAVKPGQRVRAGQVLGRLDATSADVAVVQAEAGLASARAQLAQTIAGETPAQRSQDAISAQQSQAQVASAAAAVTAQRQSNALDAQSLGAAVAAQRQTNAADARSLRAAVAQAQQQLRTDRGNLRGDVAKLKADQAQLTTDQAAYDQAKAAVDADQAAVAADQANAQRIALGLLGAQQQQAADKAGNAPVGTLADDQGSVDSWQTEQQQASFRQSQDQAKLTTDTATQNTAQSAVTTDEANVKADQSTITSLEKSVVADRNALATAQRSLASGLQKDAQALATARRALDSGVAKDRQALATARRQVVSATQAAAATRAANAVKQTVLPSAVAQQRAAVAQAEASLATARKALAETVLRAPAAGTVAAVSGIVGQTVSGGGISPSSTSSSASASASGSGGGGATPFATLTDLAGMQVLAPFSETDASKLRVGQPATVTVAALGSRQIPAHIVAIDTDSTVSSGVVTYGVTFQLDRRNTALKPGMTADVDVVVGERDNVLHVPSAAVAGTGAGASVTVLRKGTQTRVPVVAGLVGDSSTEIVSGLKAGQTVVLPSVTITSGGTGTGTGTTTGGGTGRARFFGGGGFGGGFGG
jgi:multidrug efflux pump subunit AcrA (membrane-fusion protein)